MLKRAFDIVISSFGILALAPLFALIAWRIRRDSPGPVLYRGERLGRSGKIFKMLKFRTMYERPESYNGPRLTAQDDRRVTPFGRWLRDSKLNELPQLWNVFKGEMSLVGPRPEDPLIAAEWPADLRAEICKVRPGITSPASVLYRREETMLKTDSVMDGYLNGILPSKLRLDQLYTRHHGGGSLRSFLLDLDILFWTFLVFIPPARTLQPPEVDLFWGPISRLARRYLNWFIVDTAITFSALGISGVFWRSFGPLDVGWSRAIPLAIGFAFLFSLTGAILGVNRIAWSHANASDALDLLPAVALATAAALAVNRFLVPLPQLPAGLILMAAFLASLGFVIVRYRERLLSGMAARWLALRGGAQVAQERVLILGGGSAGQFIAWMLGRQIEMNFFRVVGFVDDDMYKQGSRIRGFRVLGRRDDIPRLVSQHDIGIIIFAIHNVSDGERKALLDICASTPARLVILPDILGELRAVVQGENIEAAKYNVNGIQEQQVDTWLAELEALAKGGEYIKLEESIRRYRSQLAGYG